MSQAVLIVAKENMFNAEEILQGDDFILDKIKGIISSTEMIAAWILSFYDTTKNKKEHALLKKEFENVSFNEFIQCFFDSMLNSNFPCCTFQHKNIYRLDPHMKNIQFTL